MCLFPHQTWMSRLYLIQDRWQEINLKPAQLLEGLLALLLYLHVWPLAFIYCMKGRYFDLRASSCKTLNDFWIWSQCVERWHLAHAFIFLTSQLIIGIVNDIQHMTEDRLFSDWKETTEGSKDREPNIWYTITDIRPCPATIADPNLV